MISVVTIVRDRPVHLANMVAGLVRCDPPTDELIVVDMGSTNSISRILHDIAGPSLSVTLVELDDPSGLPLARARNVGAARAEGDRLVFLDVDCIPAPDLVSAYAAADGGTLACAPVRYLRRGWQRSAVDLGPAHLCSLSDPHPARPAPGSDVGDSRYELFWSLSFGVGRSTFAAIGGFDEGYVGYGAEDTDLAFTARRLDVPLVWLADGCAFHQWHPSPVPPVQHLASIVTNARRFREKWGRWPMQGWLAGFAEAGLIEWRPDTDGIAIADSR